MQKESNSKLVTGHSVCISPHHSKKFLKLNNKKPNRKETSKFHQHLSNTKSSPYQMPFCFLTINRFTPLDDSRKLMLKAFLV